MLMAKFENFNLPDITSINSEVKIRSVCYILGSIAVCVPACVCVCVFDGSNKIKTTRSCNAVSGENEKENS